MGFGIDILKFSVLILFLKFAHAEFEHHLDKTAQLKTIPRQFELRGENVQAEFNKYANEIETMTTDKNVTVIYKVKVELIKPDQKLNRKKKFYKKLRSKKYNVPLKKKNMKLSNFEVLLRKLAEENSQKISNYEFMSDYTTTKPEKAVTSKQVLFKYKPILGRLRTNYTKVIKPVRNKIITITS